MDDLEEVGYIVRKAEANVVKAGTVHLSFQQLPVPMSQSMVRAQLIYHTHGDNPKKC